MVRRDGRLSKWRDFYRLRMRVEAHRPGLVQRLLDWVQMAKGSVLIQWRQRPVVLSFDVKAIRREGARVDAVGGAQLRHLVTQRRCWLGVQGGDQIVVTR